MAQKNSRQKRKTFLGKYTMPDGQILVGELRLKGPDTRLKVHSENFLHFPRETSSITGVSYAGDHISLIDCISQAEGHTSFGNGRATLHYAEVFPHFVAIGERHLDPGNACIAGIHFTATDLTSLFYDFDAFGTVIDSKAVIDAVLEERRALRPVQTGERPQVAYFTGKLELAAVATAIGKVTVSHQPYGDLGGPRGVRLLNRIVVSIEPDTPVSFHTAIGRMYEMGFFLSMAAGRKQRVSRIHIVCVDDGKPPGHIQRVHTSFGWRKRPDSERDKAHPGDVPLDPIHEPAEFDAVLSHWIARHDAWRIARSRYLDCLAKGNRYDPERLVAAANMFDVLPSDAVPGPVSLSASMAATRDECRRLLRMQADGIDRDSALSALGRLGKPSLPKKVAHRASIVEAQLGERFKELQLVVSIAVKCRNHFVHGSSGDFDFPKFEPLVPFLTNGLEFVFAASDFIQAGWNATRWNTQHMGWGHNFARFRDEYDNGLMELKKALAGN